MADVRITPASGSIQFSGSISEDVISLNYTGSAVQFNSGSTNLIHISSSGFVGIGTTEYYNNNTSSFQVVGESYLAKGVVIGSPNFFYNGLIKFHSSEFSISANNVIGLNSFNISGIPAISIQYSNGDVGIGTGFNTPQAKLHVSGTTKFEGDMQVSGSIYTNGTNIQSLSIAYAIALG